MTKNYYITSLSFCFKGNNCKNNFYSEIYKEKKKEELKIKLNRIHNNIRNEILTKCKKQKCYHIKNMHFRIK